jgi:hypothetical protein
MIFIETSGFTEAIGDYLSDPVYAGLQQLLIEQPNCGEVMPGCGGLRKIRIADPKRRKGKRGGARVIYLHVPLAHRFYLLDVYGKDEKDDLSPAEKKQLRHLTVLLKQEAKSAYKRWFKENRA